MGGCSFLRRCAAGALTCEAAINFSLETTKPEDVCSSCDVLRLSLADHCRHLELYGFLYVDRDRQYAWRIGAILACGMDARIVEAGDCQACTRYEVSDMPSLGRSELD